MDPRLICSQLGSLCWRRVCCFLSRHRTNLVMTKTLLSAVCTTSVLLFASQVAAQVSITPLASFGTNGWLAPGSTPYLTTGNTERGLACNPLTGNLVLVARQNVAGVSNNVRLFDGQTGADLGGFDNTNIAGGTFPMNMVDIAEDGAIYVCNLSTSGASPFKVYRWDSELLGPLLPPTAVYDGLSRLGRTGDGFAVHPRGRRCLQTYEATANDDHIERGLQRNGQPVRILDPPQGQDVRQVRARQRQPPWTGAGRKYETVIGQLLTTRLDEPFGTVNSGHAKARAQVDALRRKRVGSAQEQLFGRHFTLEIGLGKRRALIGGVCLIPDQRDGTRMAQLTK